jgi:hypothetical protein
VPTALRNALNVLWNERSRRGKIIVVVVAVLVGLGLIGAAIPSEDTAKTSADTTTTTTTSEVTTTKETMPTASTPKSRVRAAVGGEVHAGGYAGDVQIKDLSFEGGEAQVIAKTPEGGFQGVSCGDLNDGAQAIFKTIYTDGGWNGGAMVAYQGGLVSTATGQELPTANTGIFTMPARRAQQIDWSDDDALLNIDWSLYRDYCHPALQ